MACRKVARPALRPASAPRPADHRRDLSRLRETAGVPLGEDELPVDDDVEDAAGALRELCLDPERLFQFGRQTGGPRLVVSDDAVGDLDVHGGLPARFYEARDAASLPPASETAKARKARPRQAEGARKK